MAEIPSVPQLYNDIEYARAFLNAASKEDDPVRQQSLATIGQGFAQLAQVEATWLAAELDRERSTHSSPGLSVGSTAGDESVGSRPRPVYLP
jgi:hypothetical protein